MPGTVRLSRTTALGTMTVGIILPGHSIVVGARVDPVFRFKVELFHFQVALAQCMFWLFEFWFSIPLSVVRP